MVSIILVNFNGARFVEKCLQSIYDRTRDCRFEVIVVDNASTDGSREIIQDQFPLAKLVWNRENVGFSKGNNLGAQSAGGSKLLFLNTDAVLVNDMVSILARFLDDRSDTAVVGPKLMFEDNSYQLSAGRLPNVLVELVDKIWYQLDRKLHGFIAPLNNALFSTARAVGWVTGACMMVRRDVFEQINGFDENIFMYYEDKDLCKRVGDVGWKVVLYPEARVVHLLGGSVTSFDEMNKIYRESQLYYYHKHLNPFQLSLVEMYLKISGKT